MISSNYANQCWGYYKVCNGRVFVHLKFVLTAKTPDWAGLAPDGAIPASNNNFIVTANGNTGASNSIYIFPNGSISENGDGGMNAGEYEFDFDYLRCFVLYLSHLDFLSLVYYYHFLIYFEFYRYYID